MDKEKKSMYGVDLLTAMRETKVMLSGMDREVIQEYFQHIVWHLQREMKNMQDKVMKSIEIQVIHSADFHTKGLEIAQQKAANYLYKITMRL